MGRIALFNCFAISQKMGTSATGIGIFSRVVSYESLNLRECNLLRFFQYFFFIC